MIKSLGKKVLDGGFISKEDAHYIAGVSGLEIFDLFVSANIIRNHFRGNKVQLCAIINAKSGACSEDCSFCAQSSKSKAGIKVYPLLSKKTVIQKAIEAKSCGAMRFSIVTSGKKVTKKDLFSIADMISEIREIGLLPCASLGLIREEDILILQSAGLDRYHHNLETSEKFFSRICATHNYTDKIKTICSIKSIGLSVCSGGIFGIGETWGDRIDMAFSLKELDVNSIPINFLIPIKGTSLESRNLLHPFEALKIISLYRFILPQKEIRVCGGRLQVLDELNSMVFFAGADSLLTGNYLTTSGRRYEDDRRLINICGLEIF
ncbi:MAG: biotin synthase BioB [Nitrospirota bacterium]